MGFENNLAQMIIMTRRCVANKNHIPRLNVKVIVCTETLCIDFIETSGVLGSIHGLATYFRFSFRFFKKGSCQLLAKVCAQSTG